jgi:mono/diheme cytochrome c family protein
MFMLCMSLSTLSFPSNAQDDPVKRGDYLVNRVMTCGDCHSPRDDHGQRIPGRELSGAPFRDAALHPNVFAAYAPNLRGLPEGYTSASLATLLETGHKPDGSRPRPPMPGFRLEPVDADAVAAYLATLKP